MIEQIKKYIKKIVFDEYNIEIEIAGSKRDYDLALPLFLIGKETKLSLDIIFQNLKNKLINIEGISNILFLNGFLNIYLDRFSLIKETLNSIYEQGNNYATIESNGINIVIDYSSPNIAKNFTVGHLRSTVIGNSLKLLYRKMGYNVTAINHLGDYGTQFGKIIAGFKLWSNIDKVNENPIAELSSIYKRYNEAELSDESFVIKAREEFKKLEEKDPTNYNLWKLFRELSLNEFLRIYKILDVDFDSLNGEAFYSDKMDEIISLLDERKLLSTDDNALVVKFSDLEVPALIKKSDGATLYITRDLAAILYRLRTYQPEKILYVVGSEQKLHFEQLKRLVKLLDFNVEIIHINFGLVLIDGKKMSSRGGKSYNLIDVIKEAKANVLNEIDAKNDSLKDKDLVATKVACGAILYNDLKNDRILDIDFDLGKMIVFEGNTGPYLLYSIVRINSILDKSTIDLQNIDFNYLKDDDIYKIILKLSIFRNIIMDCVSTNMPSLLARYLYQLSSDFSSFYGKYKIINENDTVRNTYLYFVSSVKIVLNEGLRLLGIHSVEKM
jgi:arginyl-tRNA synthetase